jgi:hypothetical protein
MEFDSHEIENLRKVYNEEHPKSKIPKGDMKMVWKTIKNRMHDICSDRAMECIITSMLKKPKAPDSWKTNTEEWLSSVDIDKLEAEFSRVISSYYYVGSVPINFDKKSETGVCLVDSLCSLKIKSLYDKGYTKIGIIFNTDKDTGRGQHWIAGFCDIRPDLEYPRFTYFDSYASRPEPEIQRLMGRWKQQWDATRIHSKPMVLTYNITKHQYENSECGMYSLYFHLCCLLGTPMQKRIPDPVVRAFRGLLFRVGKK